MKKNFIKFIGKFHGTAVRNSLWEEEIDRDESSHASIFIIPVVVTGLIPILSVDVYDILFHLTHIVFVCELKRGGVKTQSICF